MMRLFRAALLLSLVLLLLLLSACSEKNESDSDDPEGLQTSQAAPVPSREDSSESSPPVLPMEQDHRPESGGNLPRVTAVASSISSEVPFVKPPDEQEILYQEPDGRFSVPVPNDWNVQENQDFVTLTDSQGQMDIHIVVIEGHDALVAAAQAWDLVESGFNREVLRVSDVPTSLAGGVDEFIVVDYQWTQDDERIVQADIRRLGENIYILLYSLELEALQQRSSQLWIISTGFDIEELPKEDLSTRQPLRFDDEIAAQFESFMTDMMELFGTPGAAVAVVQDGELVYANGFGLQSKGAAEPVTPETMMMTGSTSKSLTTLLMAQLVEEGVFDWSTRVVEIFPGFEVAEPETTERITMRDLVCACSGVPRRDLEWMFNSNELTAETVVESLADFEFFSEFGEMFQYSNQMVAAGGYMAALAAGGGYGTLYEDYVRLLKENVLEPIGMDDSTFSFEEVIESDSYARPHGLNLVGDTVEIPLSYEASLIPVAPAGALWSNVIDLADYLIALLQQGITVDGHRLLSPDNLALLWEPQVDISSYASYGLGWTIEDYHGLEIISHAGNTFGYSSEFAFAPSADLGVALLSNQYNSQLNPMVRAWIFEHLFQREAETEEVAAYINLQTMRENAVTRHRIRNTIDRSIVEPYLGWYRQELLGNAILSWLGDDLILDVGEYQIEIRALLGDEDIEYATYSPPVPGLPVQFQLDELGNPVIILGMGVSEYRFDQILNPDEMIPGS